MATITEQSRLVPPYNSFSQHLGVWDRMRNEGVPSRVDRSYLASWSGTSQQQFLKAARFLGLIDDDGRPTERLKALVINEAERPKLVAEMLRDKYPKALGLAPNATQDELSAVFNEYDGISGETTRKAMAFFMHAAQFAEIELSPFFKVGKARSGPSRPRARRPRKQQEEGPATPAAPTPDPTADLHPAVVALITNLPAFNGDPSEKPVFTEAERETWLAYAQATFNFIYRSDS